MTAAALAAALLSGLLQGHAATAPAASFEILALPAHPAAVEALPLARPVALPALLSAALPSASVEDKATAELKAASAARRAAAKLGKEEKDAALAAVVESYRALLERADVLAASRAEAAFRAGEIERTRKRLAEGEALFARAVELGGTVAAEAEGAVAARDFAARALLEQAHLRRRAKDPEGALALYGEVRERFGDRRRTAAHARTWSGKLLLAAGKLDAAATELGGFLEAYPEYPAEGVRDADLLAVELFESGDEDAAREVLARVQAGVASVLEAGGKTADQVRRALDAMKIHDLLAGD